MSSNTKALLAIMGGAILLLFLFAALAGGTMSGGMVGMLFMLLFWGLVIALLVGLVIAPVVFIVDRSQR